MNTIKPKISRKRLVIFSVFVLISSVFWFLSAMNREYTTKINYKVEFTDFPEDVRPASAVPEQLQVTVKGYGYDLIGINGNSDPLKISIKEYAVKDKNDKSKLILSTHLLSNKFFPDASGISILSVDPEAIVFKVEKLKVKKVPVKPDISINFSPLYMQSGEITTEPDSIIISGTDKTIKNIQYVKTEKQKFKNLKDTLKTNLKLKKINGVKFSSEKIQITIPVEKYTEISLNVPLQTKNCPDSLQLITFPSEIKVTCKVVLSRYHLIKKEDFTLSVDYNDIKNEHTDKLKVKLENCPDFLESVQITPEFIEYIVERTH